jgi:hypothetical protein
MKDYIPLIQTAVWAVLALAVLLFFGSGIKERMKAGGSVKFGSWLELGELKNRVDHVQSDVKGLDERVRQLYLHTMSEGAYNNLKKIASKRFGPYNRAWRRTGSCDFSENLDLSKWSRSAAFLRTALIYRRMSRRRKTERIRRPQGSPRPGGEFLRPSSRPSTGRGIAETTVPRTCPPSSGS